MGRREIGGGYGVFGVLVSNGPDRERVRTKGKGRDVRDMIRDRDSG